MLTELPRSSSTAEAIRYAITRWAPLCRFLDDGTIEIDNNAAERAIRPIALGRNYAKRRIMRRYRGGNSTAAVSATMIST